MKPCDGHSGAHDENRQPPAGETATRTLADLNQPVGASDQLPETTLATGAGQSLIMRKTHAAGPYPLRDRAVNRPAWEQSRQWIEVRLPPSVDAGEMLAMLDDQAVT
jgi:hypothetical protein